MALRRRDHIPPYEIMRSRGNASAGGGVSEPGGDEQVPSVPTAEPSSRGASRAPWWVGSSAPIVLRIPRGLAAAILVGVLGLLVLAYCVGSVRGAASARKEFEQKIETAVPPARRIPAVMQSPRDGAQPGQGAQGGSPGAMASFKRKPGLNYLRLMTGRVEDARRLEAFMADKGVAILIVIDDNAESCKVYAVDYGFSAEELNAEACLTYKRKLQELGRAWKRFNNNRGTDLGTMYYERYSG